MKKAILILTVLLTVGLIAKTTLKVPLFSSKTITTSQASTDTSATKNLEGWENVEIQMAVSGTDSIRIDVYVDGYYNGKWVNLVSDSLKAVNATTTLGRGILLRGYGTNKIPGIEQIRVRNTIQNGAADDSSSALYYNQSIIGR